jgi:hypothetical protein
MALRSEKDATRDLDLRERRDRPDPGRIEPSILCEPVNYPISTSHHFAR